MNTVMYVMAGGGYMYFNFKVSWYEMLVMLVKSSLKAAPKQEDVHALQLHS